MVLQLLPTHLKRKVIEQTRSGNFLSHAVFLAIKSCSPRCFERICCDALCMTWVAPDEMIFTFNEICSHMYMISGGRFEYFKYTKAYQLKMNKVSPRMSGISGAPVNALLHHQTTSEANATVWITNSLNRTGFKSSRDRDREADVDEGFVREGTMMCEAVLWTQWVHCGDCTARCHSSTLRAT